MSITFVAAGTIDNASGVDNEMQPGLPAGIEPGDYLVCLVWDDSPDGASMDGYDLLGSALDGTSAALYVFGKEAVEDEGLPVVALVNSGGAIAQVAAWRGVDVDDPLDQILFTETTFNGSAGTLGTVAAVTPSAGSEAVVVGGAARSGMTSVATLTGDSLTWAEIGEFATLDSTDRMMVWDYALYSVLPSLTGKTFTVTGGGGSSISLGVMFTLNAMQPSGAIAASLPAMRFAGNAAQEPQTAIAASLRPLSFVGQLIHASAFGSIHASLRPLSIAATAAMEPIVEIDSSLQPLSFAGNAVMQPEGAIASSLAALQFLGEMRFHVPTTASPKAGLPGGAGRIGSGTWAEESTWSDDQTWSAPVEARGVLPAGHSNRHGRPRAGGV